MSPHAPGGPGTLPVPASPSLAPRPGEGWEVRCPACSTTGLTGPGGSCTSCGAITRLPVLAGPLDRLPPRLVPLARLLEPAPAAFLRWFRRSPWSFMFFWMALLTGFHPLSAGFVGLFMWGWILDVLFPPPPSPDGEPLRIDRVPAPATLELPPGASPRPRLTRLHDSRVEVSRSWWTMNRIRQRRGVTVHLTIRLRELQGEAVTLELRFLGPGGRHLSTPLPAYRGRRGEAVASHRTRRLRHDDSRFPDLWLYMPLRALGLPAGLVRAELVAEVAVAAGRRHLATHHLPVDFVPLPEDLWEAPVEGLPEIPGIELIGGVVEDPLVPCGVCGDRDAEVTHGCPHCGARHHPECWAYLDGCSRFGCPEAPRTPPGT